MTDPTKFASEKVIDQNSFITEAANYANKQLEENEIATIKNISHSCDCHHYRKAGENGKSSKPSNSCGTNQQPIDDLLAYKQHIHVKASSSTSLTKSLLKVLADETRNQGRTIYKVELDDSDPALLHRNFEKFFRVCPEEEMYIRLGVTDGKIEAGILHPQATRKWFIHSPKEFYKGYNDEVSTSIMSLIQPFHSGMTISEIPQKECDVVKRRIDQFNKHQRELDSNSNLDNLNQHGPDTLLDSDEFDECEPDLDGLANERKLQIEKEVLRQVYENFSAIEDIASRKRDIKYRLHKKQLQRREEAMMLEQQAKNVAESCGTCNGGMGCCSTGNGAQDTYHTKPKNRYEDKTVEELLEIVGGESKVDSKKKSRQAKKKKRQNNSNSGSKSRKASPQPSSKLNSQNIATTIKNSKENSSKNSNKNNSNPKANIVEKSKSQADKENDEDLNAVFLPAEDDDIEVEAFKRFCLDTQKKLVQQGRKRIAVIWN